jgi:hypothetical protein
MSGDRIESVIAEGVDRIALPPESDWLPDVSRARARRVPGWVVIVPVALAVMVIAAALGSGLRTVRETPATQPPASRAPVVLPSTPTPTPSPDKTRGPDASWQQLRQSLPAGVPIIEPTWLPPAFDGVQSGMGAWTGGRPADTYYAVSYAAGRDIVVFSMRGATATAPSPSPAVGQQSGFGAIVVRGSPAILEFPTDLFAHPNAGGLRVVSWTEGTYALRIESQTISGDDLLHIAWSLDQTGALGAPAARAKPGACADAATPEGTIRRLMALLGTTDRDALADCSAAQGMGVWTGLPPATLESIVPIEGAGGRRQLQVTWTFASDPGGPWGVHVTRFVLIGREDGLWRVFAVNSAPFPKAP